MAKKKEIKTPRVARTRNHGTMTESAFWGMVRSALRRSSRWWQPIQEARKIARKSVKGKRHKFEYQCNSCKEWFTDKEVAVDHIKESGELNKATAGEFIENLFCEVENLQVLCNKRLDGVESCHSKKTKEYMNNKRKKGG